MPIYVFFDTSPPRQGLGFSTATVNAPSLRCGRRTCAMLHLTPFRYGYGCLEPSLADFATRKSNSRLCHMKCRGKLCHVMYISLAIASSMCSLSEKSVSIRTMRSHGSSYT